MKIAVFIKQVPAISEDATDMEHGFVIRTGRKRVNPYDPVAIEAALAFRDINGGSVDIFSMGPPSAKEVLAEALAMGADQGWLLTDKAFAGADSLVTARTLMEGSNLSGPYDLYLCGEKTSDGDTGQVGPALAALLGLPFFGRVEKLEYLDKINLRLQHKVDDQIQLVTSKPPLVASILRDKFVARLPSLKLKMQKRPIHEISFREFKNQDISLFGSHGSPTKIKKVYHPKRSSAEILHVSPEEASSIIMTATQKWGKQ